MPSLYENNVVGGEWEQYSVSLNITLGSGKNRYLFVAFKGEGGAWPVPKYGGSGGLDVTQLASVHVDGTPHRTWSIFYYIISDGDSGLKEIYFYSANRRMMMQAFTVSGVKSIRNYTTGEYFGYPTQPYVDVASVAGDTVLGLYGAEWVALTPDQTGIGAFLNITGSEYTTATTTTTRTSWTIVTNYDQGRWFAIDLEPVTPAITSLNVTTGNVVGGTRVEIVGTGLLGTTGVTFGGSAATGVSVKDASQISCYTPSHNAGAVDVVVTTPYGTGTKASAFTYINPSKPIARVVTPTGAITKRAVGRYIPGGVSPIGVLRWSHGTVAGITVSGEVRPTGRLFIYTLRPKTIYAPFIPTSLNRP